MSSIGLAASAFSVSGVSSTSLAAMRRSVYKVQHPLRGEHMGCRGCESLIRPARSTPSLAKFARTLQSGTDLTLFSSAPGRRKQRLDARAAQLLGQGGRAILDEARQAGAFDQPGCVLLDLCMLSDPTPLPAEDDTIFRHYLDRVSQARGYDGWVDAFHRLESDILDQARERMRDGYRQANQDQDQEREDQ